MSIAEHQTESDNLEFATALCNNNQSLELACDKFIEEQDIEFTRYREILTNMESSGELNFFSDLKKRLRFRWTQY